ncbi:MAG TPA: hypothetical protein VLL25_06475 [Acidimicrobiales bacterium]|nr:hypothetical protein [Acidimicrobiales bacterium]
MSGDQVAGAPSGGQQVLVQRRDYVKKLCDALHELVLLWQHNAERSPVDQQAFDYYTSVLDYLDQQLALGGGGCNNGRC